MAVWLVISASTLNFAAVAALCAWAMTLVIQRAQRRDTQAIHAKLDELLRVHGEARNELTSLDDEDAEEVEKKRNQLRDRIRAQ
jgi:low affinity Fe/Cu permease